MAVLVLGKKATGKKYIASILSKLLPNVQIDTSTSFIKGYSAYLVCFNSYGDYVSEIKEWIPILDKYEQQHQQHQQHQNVFLCYVMLRYTDLPFLKYFNYPVFSLPEQANDLRKKVGDSCPPSEGLWANGGRNPQKND